MGMLKVRPNFYIYGIKDLIEFILYLIYIFLPTAFRFKQPYVSWNKQMDSHLATILSEQMALGYKCDGDTWKPQALQAAVKYLNSTLEMNLTKDNIKNRLKNWKKYFNVVSDIQSNQSGFTWDEDRNMIVVTSDMWSSWCDYVEV